MFALITFMPIKADAGLFRYGKWASIIQEDGTMGKECLSSIFKRQCIRPTNPNNNTAFIP